MNAIFSKLVRTATVIVVILPSGQIHAHTVTQGAQQQPQSRKTSTPYAGDLTIFDSPGRDQRLQIKRVMEILGVGPGKSVADIGAGSGWFTVRAARQVTDTGTVYVST